jgi:1-aminocyclopropane-1-carboxylate deaminase
LPYLLPPAPQLPIQNLHLPWLDQGRVEFSVLRADLCDPLLSGNKYFKLRYNLEAARHSGCDTLLSFGGVWSNHLHALAAAARQHSLRCIGIVRGDPGMARNPCLQDLEAFGMQLEFATRQAYRQRHTEEFLAGLQARHGPVFVIPEGGANALGVQGCRELLPAAVAARYDHVAVACGTGTTMLGLVTSISTPVLGIQVLKGEGYIAQEIRAGLQRSGLQATAAWQVLDGFHCGGYARVDARLRQFILRLQQDCELPLEPVYIGKVLLALQDLVTQGHFASGARVLVVHGGGLQGQRGFPWLATASGKSP